MIGEVSKSGWKGHGFKETGTIMSFSKSIYLGIGGLNIEKQIIRKCVPDWKELRYNLVGRIYISLCVLGFFFFLSFISAFWEIKIIKVTRPRATNYIGVKLLFFLLF